MLKSIIRRRLKRHSARNGPITLDDIRRSSVILFSVFTRYGDSIIAYKAIYEFIRQYPGKRYIVITSNQTLPYARAIIGETAEIQSVNIRKDPIKLMRVSSMLKKAGIDLGFNPWSHGEDSEYFLTFAGKYHCYKGSTHYPKEYNLYARIRKYLLLGGVSQAACSWELKDIRNIMIAPFSTDVTKSLDAADLRALIRQVDARFPGANITVVLQMNEISKIDETVKRFVFKKSLAQSKAFLALLASVDLFIGVDAGPLHLADALGIKTVGIFGPTAPETVLDHRSSVLTVRDVALDGIFCFVRQCKDPACIHRLFEGDFLGKKAAVEFGRTITMETEACRLPGITRT